MAERNLKIIISGRDEASPAIGGVRGALEGIGKAASAPIRALGGLTDMLGKVGLAGMGIQALAGSARGLGDALGIGLNVEMENIRAQLVAFTKDGQLADSILQDITEEASKTPFAFDAMARATAGLFPVAKQSGAALMDLVRQAEILAASNPAEGLDGAAFALREAVSGDFTSVIERFNLPRQLINQLKEEGVPALEIVSRAMQAMGYDMDLVNNLSQTASGRWSTLMDTIDGVRRTVSKSLFDNLSKELVGIQAFLDENSESISAFAAQIGQGIGNAAQRAIGFVGRLADGVRAFLGYLQEGNQRDLMREWFGDAGPIIDEVVRGLKTIVSSLGFVATDISKLLSGGISLSEFFGRLRVDAGVLLAGAQRIGVALLGALRAALARIDWAGLWTSAQGLVQSGIAWVQARIPELVAAAQAWGAALFAWVAVVLPTIPARLQGIAQTVITWIQGRGEEIAAAFTAWQPGIVAGLTTAFGTVQEFVGGIIARLSQALTDLEPTGERLGRLFNTIGGAVAVVVPLIGLVTAGLGAVGVSAATSTDVLSILTGAINTVSGAIEAATTFVSEHSGVQAVLVGLLTAAATAWTVMKVAALAHTAVVAAQTLATNGLAVAQGILNTVMAANPIGIVVIALAGLAAALVYAYNTSEDFRRIVDGAWQGVRNTVDTVSRFATTTINNLSQTIETAWADIRNATQTQWDGIGAIINGAWAGIRRAVGSAINWVINAINGMIDQAQGVINAIDGFFGRAPSLTLPKLSPIALARGGLVTDATLAQIGERGREAVLPLSGLEGQRALRMIAEAARGSAPQPALAPVINMTVHVNDREDAEAVAYRVSQILQRRSR